MWGQRWGGYNEVTPHHRLSLSATLTQTLYTHTLTHTHLHTNTHTHSHTHTHTHTHSQSDRPTPTHKFSGPLIQLVFMIIYYYEMYVIYDNVDNDFDFNIKQLLISL